MKDLRVTHILIKEYLLTRYGTISQINKQWLAIISILLYTIKNASINIIKKMALSLRKENYIILLILIGVFINITALC